MSDKNVAWGLRRVELELRAQCFEALRSSVKVSPKNDAGETISRVKCSDSVLELLI